MTNQNIFQTYVTKGNVNTQRVFLYILKLKTLIKTGRKHVQEFQGKKQKWPMKI